MPPQPFRTKASRFARGTLILASLVVLFLTGGAAVLRPALKQGDKLPKLIKQAGRNLHKHIDPSMLSPVAKQQRQLAKKLLDDIDWDNLFDAYDLLGNEKKIQMPTYRFPLPDEVMPVDHHKSMQLDSGVIVLPNNLNGCSFYLENGTPLGFSAHNKYTGGQDLFDFLGLPLDQNN